MSIILGNSKLWNLSECSKSYIQYENEINKCLKEISNVFNNLGINTYTIDIKYDKCNILWIRDMFVNLDDTIILFKCTKKSTELIDRSNEYKLLKLFMPNHIICHNKIEGGDIIETPSIIFCGIGIRTNHNGVKFLKKYTNKEIIKIKHKALHLDCCFAVLHNIIIYSEKYINYKDIPKKIIKKYKIIKLEDILTNVDVNLALNFVIVNNNIIISDNSDFLNLHNFLNVLGYNVIKINSDIPMILGGSIRCLVQWIHKIK